VAVRVRFFLAAVPAIFFVRPPKVPLARLALYGLSIFAAAVQLAVQQSQFRELVDFSIQFDTCMLFRRSFAIRGVVRKSEDPLGR